MSSSSLIRWGGPMAMLGGLISVLFAFVAGSHWTHVPVDAVRHALLAVGVVSIYLYLRSVARFGWLGRIGAYLCGLGFTLITILDVGILVSQRVEQWYILAGPIRALVLIVGLTLLGTAILRTGMLSRAGAWLLIFAALSNVGGIIALAISSGLDAESIFILPTVLHGLGWSLLGYDLWSRGGKPIRRAASAS